MHGPSGSQAVFRFSAGMDSPGQPDLLGIWSPASAIADLSFSLDAPPGPLWQADLAPDPAVATRQLSDAVAGLQAAQIAMKTAEARLASFAFQEQSSGPMHAFGTGSGPAGPEQELQLLLRDVQGEATISFGVGDRLPGELREAVRQFQGFVAHLEQMVAHFAWIETRSQGHMVARTSVSWLGDMETTWWSRGDERQSALHHQTVTLALESRTAFLRTFVLVSHGAMQLAKLPVLLGTPSGALLALPVALKFFRSVRLEMTAPRARAQANQ